MNKYVRVMDGLKSNAGNFEYKLNEINVAKRWDPNSLEPEKMGGINFGTEDKILRWLHRGDTIYDVIIPEDAEVILVDDEKGIYRANKIIVTNPRLITDDMVLDLYKKNTLSDKIIAQCLLTLIWKNRIEISKYIIKDRVNLDNIDEILKEFVNYAKNKNLEYESSQEIYNILKNINKNKGEIMKKMSKEQIIDIGNSILQESDIIANHGTSIENGLSILETDLKFNRTSMIINDTKDIISLCTYGWKENETGNSANIIISIPKEFYMKLLDLNDDAYKTWIRNIKNCHLQSHLIDSISEFDFNNGSLFEVTVPKEFIRGMFVYTDNKNYLSFLNNKEEGMNYLTYIDNKNFYTNLTDEEKNTFIDKMKNKLFKQQTKSYKQ